MAKLLLADEPPAFDGRDGGGAFVVVCEHAANRLPASLGDLGLSAADRERHIAWDPGAEPVARSLAARLDGALALQRYSRLAIDCNREPSLPDAIAELSETTPVPGNVGLSPEARAARVAEVWAPFHDGLSALLDRRKAAGRPTALVTVHSFNPVYRGVSRPWHAGIISTDRREAADIVLAALRRDPALVVGDNEPYSARDNVDYTIRRHGRDRGLPHVMIEIRNDLVRDRAAQEAWAGRLAEALRGLDKLAEAA